MGKKKDKGYKGVTQENLIRLTPKYIKDIKEQPKDKRTW